MPALYIVEQGTTLGREGRRLVVSKEGTRLQTLPLLHVSQVFVFGQVQVTTPAVHLLLSQGVDLVYLTQDGRYCGRLAGPESKRADVRLAQYRRAADETWCLALARRLVAAKIHNQRTVLLRFSREHDLETPAQVAEAMRPFEARAWRSTCGSALMGIEGSSTALYFRGLRALLPAGSGFEQRRRRPPRDPANVLLSLGYTLLSYQVDAAVQAVGLDNGVGFLHSLAYGRPSLSLDLMEELRPAVVDSLVLRLLGNGTISEADFSQSEGKYPLLLSDAGRKTFIRAFEERLDVTFRHPVAGERVTYRRCILLQAEELRRTLERDDAAYTPFLVR